MVAGVEGAAPPPTSSVFSIVRDPGECCSDVISQASSCCFSSREDREKESARAGKPTQKRVKMLRGNKRPMPILKTRSSSLVVQEDR
jgi:hypothetical protein